MNRAKFVLAVCSVATVQCVNHGSPTEEMVKEGAGARTEAVQEKRESCKALVARYQPALERVFEFEMNSYHSSMPDPEGEWYKAALAIHIRLFDLEGHNRDPSDLVHDAVSLLTQVKAGDDRRHLEYVLLGGAMPLEARREFEGYCLVIKP